MVGRKTWAADDVLTAADLNGYLMDQAVMIFASSTARGGAILAPVEGMMTYLQDSNRFDFWDGAAWTQIPAGTAVTANKVSGISIFNSSGTPVALATGDLWFY